MIAILAGAHGLGEASPDRALQRAFGPDKVEHLGPLWVVRDAGVWILWLSKATMLFPRHPKLLVALFWTRERIAEPSKRYMTRAHQPPLVEW